MTQTTTPDPATHLPPPPKAARWGTLVMSASLGISSLPVLWLAVFAGDAVLWFSAVFELLVLGAAVVGVLAGLGSFRDGWGLALACVAGTSLVTGVFAFIELRANFNTDPLYAGLLKPYLAARIAMAAGFGLLASLAVFSRNRSCWHALIKGLFVLAPAAGITVWLATRGASFLGATRATPGAEAARILMLCLGGLVLIGLISVGCHLLIRAYELGRNPADRAVPAKA